MNILTQYYNLSKTKLFIGILLGNLIVLWLSKTILINDIVFYNTYSEQMAYDRASQIFENIKKFSWVSYALLPVILFIKVLIISIMLYTGIFFFNMHFKISFGTVFKVVIASEVIFIFAGFLKFLWFNFFAGNYTLNDMGFFYPLSLINFFKMSEVNKVWLYPLQSVNLFQMAYIISLSIGLNKAGNLERPDSDKIVLTSYLPALILWIILIVFISIDTTL